MSCANILLKVVGILEKVFSKPGKIKYGNIHLLAALLSALYRFHPAFTVTVIDNVIESVSFGLEHNDFKFSQRRIAEVKYLGELYNYRMLEHPVIFDTMYRIMTFGHGGAPALNRFTPFDPPDDFFRIRLISTILETSGTYFNNKGPAGKKLDYFLSFFQASSLKKYPPTAGDADTMQSTIFIPKIQCRWT
jgi:regulator of nonsense transcripts 2